MEWKAQSLVRDSGGKGKTRSLVLGVLACLTSARMGTLTGVGKGRWEDNSKQHRPGLSALNSPKTATPA